MGVSAVLLTVMSNIVIAFIAADILLSVKRPFFYERKITKKMLCVFVLIVWAVFCVIIVIMGLELEKLYNLG